jgi:diguanylate cyclase (GGDEF)-like protein
MNFDSLTELPNLQLFLERIEQAKQANFEGKCIAIALIDIDNFRSLNDSFGHDFGNRVLIAFAKRLKSHSRFSDTVSRFSSDQFPLLITDIESAADAVRVIDEMHSAFQQPLIIDGKELLVSFRAGLSLYPYDSLSAQELFSQANQALAYTKDASDGRYRFFTPAMQSQAERRITLKHKLETALRERAFTMAYQPIVDMRKGEITKFEALVRWQSDGQWIGPDEFIPVAEEFGLIQELGEQVLDMSLNTARCRS